MIKAVVFDLDGVLVDAADWHFQALNRALGLFGYQLSHHDHLLNFNGLPTRVKLNLLSQQRHLPRALHGFIDEMKQKYTRAIFASECRPRAELTAMLSELRRRGLKLAVATNSARDTLELALERLQIRGCFDVCCSHEDVGQSKPSPQIYLHTFHKLGVSAAECLVLEDSGPGLQAARASGAHVMQVRGLGDVTLQQIERELAWAGEEGGSTLRNRRPRELEIVVPMAGLGQRFAAAGYDKPKPFIDLFGRPMIRWVIDNVRPSITSARFTFLCNEIQLREYPIEGTLTAAVPGCRVLCVPRATEGAACTVLLAVDALSPDNPMLIANSDQWVEFSVDEYLERAFADDCDGSILTFPASDTKWSYARTDERGRVLEVAEKKPISPHATVGIYYFKRVCDFMAAAEEMIRRDIRTNGEFYVCPVYNELLRRGADVRIHSIAAEQMHGLGTPEDLQAFERWYCEHSRRAPQPSPDLGDANP
jgi:HAD superfamily hydrolase (TIGR01509 family)